jgi:AAA family ATP:ADP antiporter
LVRTGPVRSLSAHPIRRFVQVEPGEGWTLTLSAALFAWLLGAYYLIQPTREAFGISAGPIYEWLWTGTATATLVATPIYGWAVARFPRNRFAPGLYLGAALALVAFWFAHGAAEGTVRRSIGYAFYIFVSTLAVFATTLFWAMMADGHRPDAARRMFGVISVGGTLGALGGSALVDALRDAVTPRDMILLGALGYASSLLLLVPLLRRLPSSADQATHHEPPLREALAGARLFISSPYLRGIGLFLAGQTLAATFLYIESREFLFHALPTRDVTEAVAQANTAARTAFFARINIAYNAIALVVQLFFVGRLARWLGLGALLASLPLVNLGGFALLAAGPSLFAYGMFEVLQRGSRFALMKPAREMLFTVLSRQEKYQAKQFLDTAVYRSTDALWAWLDLALRAALGPMLLKLAVLVPACAAWAGLAAGLGRSYRRRTTATTPSSASTQPSPANDAPANHRDGA